MRIITTMLIGSALACSVACRRQETGGAPGPTAKTDVLVRCHFVGTLALANNTNGSRLKELWGLPESRRLAEQSLQKLAHAPRTLYQVNPAQNERGAALLRPMLDDLVRHESFLQVRGPADKTAEWTLLVELPGERLKVWRASLAELMRVWNLGTAATNVIEGFPAWELKRAEAPALVRCVEAGQWLVFGIGENPLPAVVEAARRIKGGGRPVAMPSGYWLETELNLPRLRAALELPATIPWPSAKCSITGSGESLRSNARMSFPEPLPALDPWQIPTNIINDPLVSFTAARGVSPWLKNCRLLQQLELSPVPNAFFFWAQGGKPLQQYVPFQTFVAFPLPDAAAKLEGAAARAPSLFDADWQKRGLAQVAWQTNEHQLFWKGLLAITPFLRPAEFQHSEYVVGGLFPPSPVTNPPPAELFSQVTAQPKLAYYDWEITEARLFHWRIMAQLFAVIASKPQFTTNTAALPWMMAVERNLGNTVTEITADSPAVWSLVRKSHVGFTGIELVALARWLESTNFPRLSFELPPDRPPHPAPNLPSPATKAPPAPGRKPAGP